MTETLFVIGDVAVTTAKALAAAAAVALAALPARCQACGEADGPHS